MSAPSEIIEAITNADLEAVETLLAADPAAADACDPAGVSALMLAIYHRQAAIAEAIATARDHLDLREATALGRFPEVERCLDESPADVEGRSPDGFTALHYAAFFGHADLVALLLARSAPPNVAAENPMKVHPLHSAAAAGSVESVRLLLEAGAEPDAVQEGGFTALQAAAHVGHREMARILLEHGADPGRANDDGKSARDLAAAAGHDDVVALFAP